MQSKLETRNGQSSIGRNIVRKSYMKYKGPAELFAVSLLQAFLDGAFPEGDGEREESSLSRIYGSCAAKARKHCQ